MMKPASEWLKVADKPRYKEDFSKMKEEIFQSIQVDAYSYGWTIGMKVALGILESAKVDESDGDIKEYRARLIKEITDRTNKWGSE